MSEIIYCEYCGQTEGYSGKCIVGEFGNSHNFSASNEKVICKYCGKTPGVGTGCVCDPYKGMKTEGRHHFVKISTIKK